MDPVIDSILRQNYTDGLFHTHVSLIDPRGKFQFNRQTEEEFWNAYCELISKGIFKYGIAEKAQQYLPVLVDVDLKISEDVNPMSDDHLYDEEVVLKIVKIYQSVLSEIVEEISPENLMCVFLSKPPYKVNTNTHPLIKNGFHLHFPNLFLDKAEQEVHLIPRVKERVAKEMIFAYLGVENSGTVIDDSCCSVPWLLYGSKKETSADPYLVDSVYDHNLKKLSVEDAFKHYLIYDKHEKAIPMNKSKVRYYLPRILSIRLNGRETKEMKNGLMPPLKAAALASATSGGRKKLPPQKEYDKLTTDQNLALAAKLLPMLSDYRAEQYAEWMSVGWVLFNISDGSEDGLNLWLNFSSRCGDKFDEVKCRYEWDRMTKTDMTIGTLRYYASVDSPERYKEFKRENSQKLVTQSLSGSHNDIAKILHAEYGNEFVCASVSGKTWYQFIGHKWEQIEEGVFLREKISSVILAMFLEQGREAYKDGNDTDGIMKRTKEVNRIVKDLRSAPFKDNVMKEAREVFYDRRFKEKLDQDPFLIGFKNGIYDLKQNIFRAGRPEDFMSKSMPINYRQFSEDDKEVQEVYSFFEKVFPDKSLRQYFMETSSDIFVGGNFRKTVQMWIGEGDNGKSVTQMFFENMLGPGYSIKVPTTLVTGKKPMSGSAWPELARAGNGTRAMWIEEIDDKESIYTGVFKHLSGNDSFVARDLFERGKDIREIKPMFKMFCISNKVVKFHGGGDKATWNRVRAIPFESTFCRESDPAPESYEEQLRQKRFPMDPNFSKRVPELVEAFAWVLLQIRVKPRMLCEPEKVKTATYYYRQQNDMYRQFYDECIMVDPAKKLSLIELYTAIKDWFKESLPGATLPTKNEAKDYFAKLWGDPEVGMKWKGYRLRTVDDDSIIITVGGEEADITPVDFKTGQVKGAPPM